MTVRNGAETRFRREQTGLWRLASLQAVGADTVVTPATAEVRPLFKPRSFLEEGLVKFTGRKRATTTVKNGAAARGVTSSSPFPSLYFAFL